MLDTDTKRRIDTARDILVGKLPDPKSQVEQITIALIYKFMDDMDKESEELGGKPSFFTGEFARYSWSNIFDPRLGGHEIFGLYTEAILRMNQNKNIPQLFRDIFKNAYLPYRDPETLKSFLKVINDFHYDHSEKLGDAFEYLLSIMGSQGDAGQFRTPRHIIDFIVAVVEPKKNETILDPACGTAGFLISSYKLIKKENTKDGKLSLTPDDKKRLIDNFVGYDISPDMVRLSLVNMYLHGFQNPHIFEYDTLTSEERWNDVFDVIMTNPPFMTPKGGIRPHKRFSIQANRSEVLFVDYIAEHLNPNGRAGIIVPEGIIFQSANAYKALRKMLLERYMWAVVSLPAGVFNPYSGVKTSILLLDKNLVKRTNDILFVKIENDGFGLGAQRREIKQNDLPVALNLTKRYKTALLKGDSCELTDYEHKYANIVSKEKIGENGDYNFSGDRYKEEIINNNRKWEVIGLGEVCEFISGFAFKSSDLKETKLNEKFFPVIKIGNLTKEGKIYFKDMQYHEYKEFFKRFLIQRGDVLIAMTGATVGKVAVSENENMLLNQRVGLVRAIENKVIKRYLDFLLLNERFYEYCQTFAGGGAQGNISPSQILSFKIPLPPLSIQKEIVDEIEGYQKIIDGSKQVVENYKPMIKIDPEWEIVEIAYVAEINPKKSEVKVLMPNTEVSFVPMSDLNEHNMYFTPKQIKKLSEVFTGYTYFKEDDVLLAKVTPCFENGKSGIAKYLKNNIGFGSSEFIVFRPGKNILSEWIYYFISSIKFLEEGKNHMTGTGGLQRLTTDFINKYKIPVPPLKVQRQIVSQIEEEQKIIEANKKLIEIFEKKIKDKIAEVWAENE